MTSANFKCWRIYKEEDYEIRWKNKFFADEVHIFESKKGYSVNRYVQHPERLAFGEKIGSFKHKSKALESANKYMKEHDKC